MQISAMVGSIDGKKIIKSRLSGPVSEGIELGDKLGGDLINKGANEILSAETLS